MCPTDIEVCQGDPRHIFYNFTCKFKKFIFSKGWGFRLSRPPPLPLLDLPMIIY